jgi:hypothetical protein
MTNHYAKIAIEALNYKNNVFSDEEEWFGIIFPMGACL